MKKIAILASMLYSSIILAQQIPTGPTILNSSPVPQLAGHAWYRGGNFAGSTAGTKNIFGTMAGFNSPIYTYTNGINRTRLNGDLITAINGIPGQNVSGFFGIGLNSYFSNNTPRTMLHLEGPNNTTFNNGGWRTWMKTGLLAVENSDAIYVGMKPVAGFTNRSNAVIDWSDDAGADKLSFVFTAASLGNGNGTNPINSGSFGGYEFMMMVSSTTVFNGQGTGEGTIGVGPVFTDAAPPQSRFHMNAEERMNNWLQITNQNGTGQLASDGFRFGILGNIIPDRNGNAFVYQQEERHLLFSTNANTNVVNPLNTLERMRITSINAPTELASNGYGVYNPANLNGNLTRVAISHNPINPVTRPLSLLHLGYNTGAVGFNPTSTDGWRNWMDIGTFTNNGTDNMYVGLKTEAGAFPASDRQDAIINWGDNDASNPLNGPDNLRFIFTSTTTGAGNTPANSNDGLEVARMVPTLASTLTPANYGMMGIGDWTTPANIATPIDAKLDIDGDLRIRQIENDNTLYKVLVVDEPDHNRVHWRDLNSFTLGNNCSAATPNILTDDYEIDMNGENFFFHNNGEVNIGDVSCGQPSNATLFVRNTSGTSGVNVGIWTETVNVGTAGIFNGSGIGISTTADNAVGVISVGLAARANGVDYSVGVFGEATGASNTNYGVRGEADGITTARNIGVFGRGRNGSINWGGYFQDDLFSTTGILTPSDSIIKQNIQPLNQALATLKQLQPRTFEYNPTIHPSSNFPTGTQFGLIAQDVELVLPELVKDGFLVDDIDSNGVVIDPGMDIKTLNYSGFIPFLIQGVKELDAQVNAIRDSTIARDSTISRNDSLINDINNRTLSDGTLKNNVTPLTNSLSLIQQLNGINFKWDTLSFPWKNFETDNQIGYIAQDVNNVVPEVVFQDDSGYFHVDYQRLMPLVTEGMKQLDDKNKMLDSINNDLQNQLNDIKACLQNANICNQGNKTSNNAENEGKVIELENLNAIILDQNLPNPFAEKTSINYVIPTDVKEAQLLFYDMNGRIIKQVDITERGEGKLTVYGENLQNGIYTYSLIADGKLIATKKMVKQ